MEIRYQIIRLLADGRFHSGEEMAAAFSISRAAIWKQMKVIKEQLNLDVFAVRGKGYRLAQPLELLDKALINSSLGNSAKGLLSSLEVHSRIGSTNSHLMAAGNAGANQGVACLAEQQTEGKGRRGRRWVSPYGSNIYLSLLWRYNMGLADLSGLSLAAGIAVVRGLERLGVSDIGLKWPNDIHYQQRKLAGLLLEVAGEQDGPSRVVVGLGLNTGMTGHQGAEIDQPWIDLSQVPGGKGVSRNRLVSEVLSQLLETMEQFGRNGLEPLIDEWHRLDLYFGKEVTLLLGEKSIEGIHRGIDRSGALLLELDGKVQLFHGGEVSLRGA